MIAIHVKQFEDPNNFYFTTKNDRESQKRRIKEMESEVTRYSAEGFLRPCTKKPGSIVGYLHYLWLQWVRGRIVSVKGDGSVDIFLVDRGYSMNVRDTTKLMDLPDHLQNDLKIVLRGSLGLVPCDQIRDHHTREIKKTAVRFWDQKAIKLKNDLNEKNKDGKGSMDWQLAVFQEKDGVFVGDLFLKTPLESRSIRDMLIKDNLAITEEGFQGIQQKPKPSPLPNVANFRDIAKRVFPEILVKVPEKKPQKAAQILPSGVNIGDFTKHRKEEEKKLVTIPMAARPARPQMPKRPPAEPPLNLLVFGQHLRPKFQSFDNTTFSIPMKSLLKNNYTNFTEVQAHSWPHLHYGRSMIIIEKLKNNLTMTYLPAILNKISSSRISEVKGLGPIAVIVTKSMNDFKDISRVCSKIAPNITVIEAFGICNKTAELINGCDLLVTTPPAFCRLVNGIALKLFDKKRIKYLVFHAADQMLGLFDCEINEIMRKCFDKGANTDLEQQLIVTSCSWTKGIGNKLAAVIDPKNLVICAENFIDAAVLVGLKFVMQLSSGFDEKCAKLLLEFAEGTYKSTRTLVVANDKANLKRLATKFQKAKIEFLTADDENYEVAKGSWEEQNIGSFSVLVTYDSIIEKMELTSAQKLIHFAIPKSWNAFCRRFSSLMKHFYLVLEKKTERSGISTTILLDDESNVNDFVHLIRFMQSRKMEVSKSITTAVEVITSEEENMKRANGTSVCESMWNFGECKKSACSLRHTFSPADSAEEVHAPALIQFQLLSVKSPVNFVIKILYHRNEHDWVTWKYRNSEIENFLEEDLQAHFLNNEKRKPAALKVGGTYAALFEDVWRRCKVIQIDGFISQVQFIDEGINRPCRSSNIFDLPEEFKKIKPLAFELSIMNLVPFDKEDTWDPNVTEQVAQMLKKFEDDFKFVAQVKFSVENKLLTETFEVKDAELIGIKFLLKNKLCNMNLCCLDENVEKNLQKLFVDGKLIPKPAVKAPSSKSSNGEETKSRTVFMPQKDEEAPVPVRESWKILSWDSCYEVHMKHYKNPESFFVILDSRDNNMLTKAMKNIENCQSKVPLEKIEAGAVCAVDGEKIRRAKIINVEDDVVDVLLVDLGELISCQAAELLELSSQMKTTAAFQTVHCRLIGIKPKLNKTEWSPKQCEAVEKLIRSYKSPLKMHVVRKTMKSDELNELGMNSYDVVLIDSQSNRHLDDLIVEMLCADRDNDYEKPKCLDEQICIDSGNVSAEVRDSKDMDLLKALLEKNLLGSQSEDEDEYDYQTVPETLNNKESQEEISSEEPLTESPETAPVIASTLKYLWKQPKVEWQQNDVSVRLLISASDCKSYSFLNDETSLVITINYADNRVEKAIIDLYSVIDNRFTSHEIRGLNVIVRFVKKIPNVKWPRLTQMKERSQFIKYNSTILALEVDPKFATRENLQNGSLETKRNGLEPTNCHCTFGDETLALSDDEDNNEFY